MREKAKRDRLTFVLIVIVVTVLIAVPVYYIDQLQQEYEQEENRLIEELDVLVRLYTESNQKLEEIQGENETLRELLNQREEMSRQLSSRSGRPGFEVYSRSGLTAAALDRVFEQLGKWAMVGLGEHLVEAERKYRVNALLLVAIVAHESVWGTSEIAQRKGNLAGLGAFDSDPYGCAHVFDQRELSIYALAELLRVHYSPGGKYYGGSGVEGLGVCYATDPQWAAKVTAVMQYIMGHVEV